MNDTGIVDPHDLIPPPADDQIDRYVQRWVAGTNGNLYVPLINKLRRYPIPTWPGPKPQQREEFLLDIGCSWGRWMVAAARTGYLPVGIDIKVDAIKAARRVLKHHNLRGYLVAADLMALPFRDGSFDRVFSYSVIQHTHRRRAASCVRHIERLLKPGGACYLQFPTRYGLTNWRHRLRASTEDGFDSWCVRYYTWAELRELFEGIFGNVRFETDCFFGIGVKGEDLDLMPWRYKPIVIASESLKALAAVVPPLKRLSDSVFVACTKKAGEDARFAPPRFNEDDNLWILPWLQCPVSGGPLDYDPDGPSLVSKEAGLRYRIDDDVPVLIPGEAAKL